MSSVPGKPSTTSPPTSPTSASSRANWPRRSASSAATSPPTPAPSPTTGNATAPARPSPPRSSNPRSTMSSANAWSKSSRCAGAPAARTYYCRSAPASSTTPSPTTTDAGTPTSPTQPIKSTWPRNLPRFVPLSQFGVSADRRQRGAQFVGGVGDELPDPGFRCLPGGQRARDVAEHLVQRGTDLADLGARVGVAFRDPDSQPDLAAVQGQGADPPGDAGHPIQRCQGTPDDPHHHGDSGQQRDPGDGGHDQPQLDQGIVDRSQRQPVEHRRTVTDVGDHPVVTHTGNRHRRRPAIGGHRGQRGIRRRGGRRPGGLLRDPFADQRG